MSVSIYLHDISLSQSTREFYNKVKFPDIHSLFLTIDDIDKTLVFRHVEEILDVSKDLPSVLSAEDPLNLTENFDAGAILSLFDNLLKWLEQVCDILHHYEDNLFKWLEQVRDILRSPASLKKGRFELNSLLVISRVISFLKLSNPTHPLIKSVYLEIANALAALSIYRYSVLVLSQIVTALKGSSLKRSKDMKELLHTMEEVIGSWVSSCKENLPSELEVS
jgi:hypothetical protein